MAPVPGYQVAHIGLGSNLEDPARQVRRGFAELEHVAQTRVTARSSLYRSAPVGQLDQPDFVNAVAVLETALTARQLLQQLLAIETRLGRVRQEINGPRILDLDLLLFGGQKIDEPGLTVPHPRLHERAFVLLPLAEVSPALVIPQRGAMSALLAGVTDQRVERLDGGH